MIDTDLPNFKIDESKIPLVKIRSIRIQNLKGYKDYTFDFSIDPLNCKSFVCFHGPNGTGKTTILDVIQLIFSRFDNYEEDRLKALLGKSVRHEDGNMNGIYGDDNFLITAVIQKPSCIGHPEVYEVKIDKTGFINDHPNSVKKILGRLCFYGRLDQELHQFQLNREKWPIFKELCEAVTGYEIEEKENVFDMSEDPIQADLLKQYVLGFWVKKPYEKISHTECSAGEKKVIKSFSTLLNMEYTPRIICIDNVTMHVELERHIALIESIKKCFPDSQIFATTHSYRVSRNFGSKDQMYDLRLVTNPNIREIDLQAYDEIRDCISKLKSLTTNKGIVDIEIVRGEELIDEIMRGNINYNFRERLELYIKRVVHLHIIDMCKDI
jgi:ABC-type lipoprotein export system ATPase subunit